MPTRALQREWLGLHLSEHASRWAVAVVYLAAYVILEWASFIHLHKGLPVTPWDPGLGVAFALMVRGGPLSGLILFAGMVIAETFVLQNDVDWRIDIGVAAITAEVENAGPNKRTAKITRRAQPRRHKAVSNRATVPRRSREAIRIALKLDLQH